MSSHETGLMSIELNFKVLGMGGEDIPAAKGEAARSIHAVKKIVLAVTSVNRKI